MPSRFPRPAFGKCGELIGDRFDVDDDWIEVFWHPLLALVMALVPRIVDGFEGFGIARWSANIFGRASSAGLQQAWIALAGYRIDETLDLYDVLPTVTEVIEIV